MCYCECSLVYRKLPYLHALSGFLEMVFVMIRLGFFLTPRSNSTNIPNRQEYSGKYVAAFLIDLISSIVATLIGLFTLFLFFIILFKVCAFCINASNKQSHRSQEEINTTGVLRKFVRNKALRRFLIIDCNCPCYKARPLLRFQVRFVLLLIFFSLRITAIGLYASSSSNETRGNLLAIFCAISLIFIFVTLSLDLYRYFIWWHYTPQDDTRCQSRSKKHQRYLPYHMVGEFRDSSTLGDRPCTDRPCHKRTLDHITVFHSSDYQPQARWRDLPKPALQPPSNNQIFPCCKSEEIDNQPHYIGFHTTDPDSAIKIVHSEFHPGKNGWLGPGVYFARSVAGTVGKAKSLGGAHIIAEIRMGKVFEVEREVITRTHSRHNSQIFEYVHRGQWQNDYDTCYMIHEHDNRDEFAIRDAAKQIVKWIVVIDEEFDPKVERFGLATEFESTQCGCIWHRLQRIYSWTFSHKLNLNLT